MAVAVLVRIQDLGVKVVLLRNSISTHKTIRTAATCPRITTTSIQASGVETSKAKKIVHQKTISTINSRLVRILRCSNKSYLLRSSKKKTLSV